MIAPLGQQLNTEKHKGCIWSKVFAACTFRIRIPGSKKGSLAPLPTNQAKKGLVKDKTHRLGSQFH